MTTISRPCVLAFTLLAACGTTETMPVEPPVPPPSPVPTTTPITVTRPGSGDAILCGATERIEWNPPAGVAAVDIVLAGSGEPIAIANHVSNTGSYAWQVPMQLGIGAFDLRVIASNATPAVAAMSGVAIELAALGGLRWNGTAEEYDWIDPATGKATAMGTVGDLQLLPWPRPAAADPAAHRLYVLGYDPGNHAKLYTLDTRTGALVTALPLAEMPTTLVARGGKVFAISWNDAAARETIAVLDPVTGTQTPHGTLGDLTAWASQTAIDDIGGKMYALGLDTAQRGTIYTVDLATGAALEQAVVTLGGQAITDLVGLGRTATGQLTAFRWNDATHQEQLVHLDPHTGIATAAGIVGDLQLWGDTAVVHPSSNELYVFGSNGTNDKMYVLDADTGEVTSSPQIPSTPMTAMPVY